MADDNTDLVGKKIFFIHPSVFVQNDIIGELAQQEYEVYIARDEQKLQRVLRKYPGSIVFASIEETLSPGKWETWIRQIMTDKAAGDVPIGVLSNTGNEDFRRLYLNTLKVPCGFISLRTDASAVTKTLLEILKTADAKGRRKYIRADTRGETMTTINFPCNGDLVNGEIRDISVVGLSCVFSEDPELEKNALFSDIQIKLQSALLKAEGIVFGSRMEGNEKIYVLVFTQKIDPAVRTKIKTYIQKNLQSRMDAELK
ncbi:MAG: PilZ domain-containing protein [Treponema sp.]|jgi:hypothetical protein|nr:PilZ domain-containing protein [Treponema sp.]